MRSSPDLSESSAPLRSTIQVDGHELIPLEDGWQAAATLPDACTDPSEFDALSWLATSVPGTAASTLANAGLWRLGEHHDFAAEDWWFRIRFAAMPPALGEQVALRLEGIATVADVYLNGERVLASDSMFAAHRLNVGTRLRASGNELALHCRALEPLLRERRWPRARWRTRLVSEGNLRFFRTMLLGWAPGIAPGPATVGPWRDVSLERCRRLTVEELVLRSRIDGDGVGTLAAHVRLSTLGEEPITAVDIELSGRSGTFTAPLLLEVAGNGVRASGELTAPAVARWWPHTHGEPVLHKARLLVRCEEETVAIDAGRVGFRALAFGATREHDVEQEGLDLHLNGVRVFARGAVWTAVDAVGLAPSPAELRAALEQVRDAGMNMLRLPGTSAYETNAFHDLCDELGILVWQDFMFANLDYPLANDTFRDTVEREARQELDRVAGRPSLVVLCGNSEIEQQVAMLGLDPALGRGELFGELLPALVRESGVDAVYIPSAPCGGDLPFRSSKGVANYYGVGGYRRPLEDARRAGVRFAAECLAFSNVPGEAAIEELLPEAAGRAAVHDDPRWKASVPRDAGSDWDFEDVRDHYLALLFQVDSGELRRTDRERYLELSRAVTGEVMGEVFGEWRRAASPCGGGLVLWLRDRAPGAGWGVVDHRGLPKVAYHHLRRALAPVACWMTDEGLDGVATHVANDGPDALACRLRIALYRDRQVRVQEATKTVELAPHSVGEWNVETLLGNFVDVSWAYRFGPPQQDLVVASLERDPADASESALEPISQSLCFPAGRPLARESVERLGLEAGAEALADGAVRLRLRARRFVYGVRLHIPGFTPTDDAFHLEPGVERALHLHTDRAGDRFAGGHLTALNLAGKAQIEGPQVADREIVPGRER
jgi:beta-mannosidase